MVAALLLAEFEPDAVVLVEAVVVEHDEPCGVAGFDLPADVAGDGKGARAAVPVASKALR